MQVFDGRKYALELEETMKKYSLDKTLAIVQVGENAGSEKYIKLKKALCDKLSISSQAIKIEETLSDSSIFDKVRAIFSQESIGGGIIQLPLPRKSLHGILDLIPKEKDLDLLSNMAKKDFFGNKSALTPPVVRAFQFFLDKTSLDVRNMKVAVVGYGELVGKPIVHFLKTQGAKVETIQKYTHGTSVFCQLAVLSAGVAGMFDSRDLPDNCNVVDFGSSVINGKTVGDLDLRADDTERLGAVSMSPGGMGPLVVRFLIMNFLGL